LCIYVISRSQLLAPYFQSLSDSLLNRRVRLCLTRRVTAADMGNEQSSPLQQAAAHDDIDKVHALVAQNRIELHGTDKVRFDRSQLNHAIFCTVV
jgi:hypothetical protein